MYCNFEGGELPDGKQFALKAPGARHHARWMSNLIYIIKIAMLQHQLKNDIPEHFLMKIVALAQFFVCIMSSHDREQLCTFKLSE